jgi:hypothetical protein
MPVLLAPMDVLHSTVLGLAVHLSRQEGTCEIFGKLFFCLLAPPWGRSLGASCTREPVSTR